MRKKALIVAIVCVNMLVTIILYYRNPEAIKSLLGIELSLIGLFFLIQLLLTPRRVATTEREICIVRNIGNIIIPWSSISEARQIGATEVWKLISFTASKTAKQFRGYYRMTSKTKLLACTTRTDDLLLLKAGTKFYLVDNRDDIINNVNNTIHSSNTKP